MMDLKADWDAVIMSQRKVGFHIMYEVGLIAQQQTFIPLLQAQVWGVFLFVFLPSLSYYVLIST